MAGQAGGGRQSGRRRRLLSEVDVQRGTEQRQPPADDEQPPMFGQGLAGVQQTIDIRQVSPDAAEQGGRRRLRVGDRQLVDDSFEPAQRLVADVTGCNPTSQF
jgi:hypothetical protein